jgi:hypothetical protein
MGYAPRMRTGGVLAAVALVAVMAFAGPARADNNNENIPWPQALPALPVGNIGAAHPVPHCETPSIGCVDDLAARLQAQWQAWDATCDHRAVMALAYLRITQELRREYAAGAFDDPEWMAFVVAQFSNEYFKANADYDAGRPVAPAWKTALDAMTKGDTTAIQDTLLFSQAHVGHDYPYILASQGIRSPDGKSRKHDHDQINEVNAQILDGVQDEVAARYDQSMGYLDLKPSPVDELLALETVKVWRETTWRHAELLTAFPSGPGRQIVDAEINAQSSVWTGLIATPIPGWRKTRDAFCAAQKSSG